MVAVTSEVIGNGRAESSGSTGGGGGVMPRMTPVAKTYFGGGDDAAPPFSSPPVPLRGNESWMMKAAPPTAAAAEASQSSAWENVKYKEMSSYAATAYPPSAPYQRAGAHGSGSFGRGRPASGGSSWQSRDNQSSSFGNNHRSNEALGASLRPVNWASVTLSPFQKNFYQESESVARMSPSEVQTLRNDSEISIVSGADVPKPVVSFEDLNFPNQVLRKIKDAGFEKPSPIQCQAWPIALSGRDMIGIAETGSGKTIAFLLPAVVHINVQERIRNGEGPIALIIAPTRELVEQIKEESNKFAFGSRTAVAYGGASKRGQMMALSRGCEILCACPGRLIDFMERSVVNLRRVTYLVLDEADRMLDMGFEPQIRKIVDQIRPDRQTLMFSATWPKEVQALARDLCREEPVHVTIGSMDLKASHNVEQIVQVVTEDEKAQKLQNLLQDIGQGHGVFPRTIIFTETKRNADMLTRELRNNRFPALGIHGDKEQNERKYVLEQFKHGNHPIMIATDVASRGLDVKDVKVVINYDMPGQIEDYVHRIGRTGRAGAKGKSYSFITADKAKLARDLVKILEEANQVVPNELRGMCSYGGRGGNSRGYGGNNRRYGGGSSSRGPYGQQQSFRQRY